MDRKVAGINGLYPLKSATATVNIQVTHADDYSTWVSQWAHPGIGGPQDDFNGDGMNNNEKRIWGFNPTDASLRQPIILPTLHPTDDLAFSYTRRNPSLTGMSFSVWVSTDMVEWREDTAAVQTASAPDATRSRPSRSHSPPHRPPSASSSASRPIRNEVACPPTCHTAW